MNREEIIPSHRSRLGGSDRRPASIRNVAHRLARAAGEFERDDEEGREMEAP